MKNFLFLLVFISFKISAQDCSAFTSLNHFNQSANVDLFIEGRGESYPYVKLSVIIDPKNSTMMQIMCHGGVGQKKTEHLTSVDYNSLSAEPGGNSISERLAKNLDKNRTDNIFNITQLHFIFDDGQGFTVYSEAPLNYSNTVFIYKSKNADLFNHFKSNKLTDIKVVFSSMNAVYKLPLLNSFDTKSNQDFFINLFRCNGW